MNAKTQRSCGCHRSDRSNSAMIADFVHCRAVPAESRAHALEMATALKEIAGAPRNRARLQDLVRQGQPHLAASAARGIGLAQALPIFAEIRPRSACPC